MREVVDLSEGMFVDTRDEGAEERLVALARSEIEGVELRNLTTRELGNVALSADRRAFAGEVALAPGENRLGLRFLLSSSIGFARELVVDFQPLTSPSWRGNGSRITGNAELHALRQLPRSECAIFLSA